MKGATYQIREFASEMLRLDAAHDFLESRERLIVEALGSGRKLQDCGTALNVTRQRVRQLLEPVMSKYLLCAWKHNRQAAREFMTWRELKPLPRKKRLRLSCSAERFFGRFEQRGSDECWPWTGPVNQSNGYGTTTVKEIRYGHIRTNEATYFFSTGELPPGRSSGKRLLLTCHNNICCNPAHLRVGTHRDTIFTGTEAPGERRWSGPAPR